jgi:hypothetical protein
LGGKRENPDEMVFSVFQKTIRENFVEDLILTTTTAVFCVLRIILTHQLLLSEDGL